MARLNLFFLIYIFFSHHLLAFDHRDSPSLLGEPMADLASLYLWTQGSDTILIMTVNPLNPGGTTDKPYFSPRVAYKFFIDNTGDLIAEHIISCVFSAPGGGRQWARVKGLPNGETVEGEINTPIPRAEKILKSTSGKILFFAGPRDDPFFFDQAGFENNLTFTNPGKDSFKGTNVSAIVLQLPTALLVNGISAQKKLAVWAATAR